MKTKLILLLVMAGLTVSCGKMVDWTPVNLCIEVHDRDGNDLLDPANDNSWLEGTVMIHDGMETPLQSGPDTKYYMPEFYGFRLQKGEDRYQLVYGEIDGGVEYKNDEYTVLWPDGSRDVITLTRRLNELTINARTIWKLNREKTSSPIVIIR